MSDDSVTIRKGKRQQSSSYVSTEDQAFYGKQYGGLDKLANMHYARRNAAFREHFTLESKREEALTLAREQRAAEVRRWTYLSFRQCAEGVVGPVGDQVTEPIAFWQRRLWQDHKHYEHRSRRPGVVLPETPEARANRRSLGRTPAWDPEAFLRHLKVVYSHFEARIYETSM